MKVAQTSNYLLNSDSTWRTLNEPVLEDRPLALCDSRSVDPIDLVAADRIIPALVGEVYYLTHNPKHEWFWLEKQTPLEPFAFVMYDTKAGSHARCKLNQFCTIWYESLINNSSLSACLVRQPEGAGWSRTTRVN